MAVWDDLVRQLDVMTWDGEHWKSTPEDVDRFEAETGFRLPDDYREFAVAIGPGTIGNGEHEFDFLAPGFPETSGYQDLTQQFHRWRKDCQYPGGEDHSATTPYDPGRYARLLPFCFVGLVGDGFGWDPADVSDPDRHEYGIYIIGNDNGIPMDRVAGTFREFIVRFVLGGGYERHFNLVKSRTPDPVDWDGSTSVAFGQGPLGRFVEPVKPKRRRRS